MMLQLARDKGCMHAEHPFDKVPRRCYSCSRKEVEKMKIDIFSHFLPKKYMEAVSKKVDTKVMSVWAQTPPLSQIDVRLRVMDMYPDVMQVLTVATLPMSITLEAILTPRETIELSKIANDEMAEVVAKYPNKFLSAVACLPLNDIDASIKEADRAITQLHFRGI